MRSPAAPRPTVDARYRASSRPSYDDDAAVTTTDLGSDQATRQLDSALPGAVLDTAREWERHVVEIETGLPPGAEPGVAPKPQYDPTSTTVVDRDRAKAAELGVGDPMAPGTMSASVGALREFVTDSTIGR